MEGAAVTFPGGIDLTTVMEDYFSQSGTVTPIEATGTVTFTPGPKGTPIYINIAGHGIVLPGPVIGVVDPTTGIFSVDLIPEDADGIEPTGFTYHVVEDVTVVVGGKTIVFDREYDIPIPSSVDPVHLSDIVSTVPSGGVTGFISQINGLSSDGSGHLVLTAADVGADASGTATTVGTAAAAALVTETIRAEAAEAALYTKPGPGIPSGDLSSAVQAVLTGAELTSHKNSASGYAGLDSASRVAPANSALVPQVQTPAFASTVTIDASTGSEFDITLTGNLTLGNPTNSVHGQKILFALTQDGTGGRTLTLGSAFDAGPLTVTLSTAANKVDYLLAKYRSAASKWDVLAFGAGY